MINDTYTPEEFATCYSMRGYGKKKAALKWLDENNMQTAHESDFQRCYHDLNTRKVLKHGRKYIALYSDGINPSDPENQPNSNPFYNKR